MPCQLVGTPRGPGTKRCFLYAVSYHYEMYYLLEYHKMSQNGDKEVHSTDNKSWLFCNYMFNYYSILSVRPSTVNL